MHGDLELFLRVGKGICSMKYEPQVFVQQFPLVKQFIHHLICYRELSKAYRELGVKSAFWTATIDAHLSRASLLWCMVFGSEGSNQLHWKKLSQDEADGLQESFRQAIQNKGITLSQWETCWHQMKGFRDSYVAHRDREFNEPVPDFTMPFQVAFIYDEWIREIIAPDVFEEPPLESFAGELRASVAPQFYDLLKSSKID
jgi:hypothetical protein